MEETILHIIRAAEVAGTANKKHRRSDRVFCAVVALSILVGVILRLAAAWVA